MAQPIDGYMRNENYKRMTKELSELDKEISHLKTIILNSSQVVIQSGGSWRGPEEIKTRKVSVEDMLKVADYQALLTRRELLIDRIERVKF